jgi:7-cyano-7-deazaguanine synthase
MSSVIIYSGGMDSSVLLYQRKADIALAVSFQYGSKHNVRELESARANCMALGIEHKVVHLDFVADLFRSDLLQSGGSIPEGHFEDEIMRSTVIPFRNGIMLSIAAGIAESADCGEVLIANHAGDHAIYPDCRAGFIDAMARAIVEGTFSCIKLSAPFTRMTKREIALEGKRIGMDFGLTYSCYKGGPIHCGKCRTCVERKEALAGFDTTEYMA